MPSQNLFIWTMENVGKVQIRGIDLNAQANGKFSPDLKWSVRLAYTWQKAIDVTDPTSAEYKNEIPYTPENSGSVLATLYYKTWSCRLQYPLFPESDIRLEKTIPPICLPGWITQDLFISCKVPFHDFGMTIKGEVNNIFNEHYDVIHYYPMPGRSYQLSHNH